MRWPMPSAGDLAVNTAILHQLVVRADPGHTALVQHDDAVGMADRADALRHDQAGRVAQLARQTGAEAGIGAVIQRGERIIKDEDLRLAGQCARDGKALLLAA